MSIGYLGMSKKEHHALRVGYCQIAANCIWDNFELSRSINSRSGKTVLNVGQMHTRLLEVLVPDPFLIQYVSKGYIDSKNKKKSAYREHVVPCSFLLKEISNYFHEKQKTKSKDQMIQVASKVLSNHLSMAIRAITLYRKTLKTFFGRVR